MHDGCAVIGGCGIGIRVKADVTAPCDRVIVLTVLKDTAMACTLHLLVVDVKVEGMIVSSDIPLLHTWQKIEYGNVFIKFFSIDLLCANTDFICVVRSNARSCLAQILQVARPGRTPRTASGAT